MGCAVATIGSLPRRPHQRDATILIDEVSTTSLYQRLRPTGPEHPHAQASAAVLRLRLRPPARYTFLPYPVYRISNLKTIDEIGPHRYDSGVVTRSGAKASS
jgi:hypothetical protein